MKRIIVTGATSMIGTALIEECIRHDIEVYAVVRAGSSKTKRLPESARIHQIECELEKLEELPAKITGECDTFFHIAWGNTGENRNSSTELQSRNVFYTLKAVRAAHAMGCKRFIGAGSQAEYGPMDVPRIAPDSPVHPTTPYGASKLAANQLSSMLCKELGMEWIWPRIFSVYGIYEKETTMIASGLRKMLKGEKTEFTPAEQRWDYLYSKDAGRAYYLIGEKGRDGAVYCVGSGQAYPLWEYIMQMEAQMQKGKEKRSM
ncbi:MAG: SDR family oxidoreductase [Blautia obeum]|nr:SDR family oxidoreductase [Blautia obeum]